MCKIDGALSSNCSPVLLIEMMISHDHFVNQSEGFLQSYISNQIHHARSHDKLLTFAVQC